MDPNLTRQIPERTVLYHCTCGEQLVFMAAVGGECSNCNRKVSPRLLDQDLGMTIALDDEYFELDQTASVGFDEELTETTRPVKSDPESLNGEMFGHFKLVTPLGSGGMGQVYRAFDTSLQRYVAVKLLRSGIGAGQDSTLDVPTTPRSSDQEVEKLLQEAVAQARVTHPNIVTIYYVGKQNGNPFLAMELVNGEPLSDRVTQEMPFDEIAPIALEITQALQYSFDLDIIHGDIKPSNVLITKNGMAKLSDFGMARSASEEEDKSVGGTPNYIAPELLHGELASIQSDIYALGVTIFEMTFGKLPRVLTGPAVAKWIEIHDNEPVDFPAVWPDRHPEIWKSVLEKMLATDPADRYQSYDELLAALKPLQPGSKTNARFFPRLIAAGIDWATALSLAVVFQVGVGFSTWQTVLDQYPALTPLMRVCNFLPIIGFTVLTYFWRQSIGRTLMHIRVVNQFGMRPSASKMALRSLMRMQFPWVVIALELFRTESGVFYSLALSSIYMISIMFLMLDLAFMVMYSKNRSIHDVVFKTRVQLDTTPT